MRIWQIFIILIYLFFGSLVYGFLGINIVMLVPIYFLYQKKYKWSFATAFGSGLLLDLVNLTPLGLSSALMLLGIGFLWFFWEKAVRDNLLVVFAAFFGFDLFFHWILDGTPDFRLTFITTVLYMAFSLLFLRVYRAVFKNDDIFLQ